MHTPLGSIHTPVPALALAAALAACAPEAGEEAGAGADTAAAERGMPGADTAAGAAAGMRTAQLRVDTLEGAGAYLTDAEGRALYLFTADSAGRSTCYDACAEAWPPLVADGAAPSAGAAGVQAGLIGTTSRRTGESQVTYGQHPLYYYREDRSAGEATGQDVHGHGGEWYLVTPEGEQLEGGGEGRS